MIPEAEVAQAVKDAVDVLNKALILAATARLRVDLGTNSERTFGRPHLELVTAAVYKPL